jgi:hypothetical protein
MVLTPEEQAQLDALIAKKEEAAPPAPGIVIKVAEDVAEVIRQLTQVHWASIAPEVGQAFIAAVDAAKAEAHQPEPEPEPEPEPAPSPESAEGEEHGSSVIEPTEEG